jgi:hypothetical protein
MSTPFVDTEAGANQGCLRYLGARRPDAPPGSEPAVHPDPYWKAGTHPDIVEKLWDGLGNALPQDCRWMVCGVPALVHPIRGIILAVGLGTQYGLRLADATAVAAAVRQGAETAHRYGDGHLLDLTTEFGPDWVFGHWRRPEGEDLAATYKAWSLEAR